VDLNYRPAGATDIANPHWSPPADGFRAYERSARIGSGTAAWEHASAAVMVWGVKTRSGFDVVPGTGSDIEVRLHRRFTLVARIGPCRVREPVQVVTTVREPGRQGFAYGTCIGHPVSGEEAFIVWQDEAGDVWLTLRSLTRPSSGIWRVLFPLLLVAQRWYRMRYLRALRAD
jgi:uncharacterized protein (UPF0548 family)